MHHSPMNLFSHPWIECLVDRSSNYRPRVYRGVGVALAETCPEPYNVFEHSVASDLE